MVKLKKLKQAKPTPRLQFETLQSNPVLRETYEVAVKNRFAVLSEEGKTKWDALKIALVETANKVIPIKGKQYRNKWMTDEILALMKKRQKIGKYNSREYKEIDKEIKNKGREAKEAWLSDKCEEIRRYKNTDPSSMHRKIKELAGPIIIKSEVRAAVNKMTKNKAAGPDKIMTNDCATRRIWN